MGWLSISINLVPLSLTVQLGRKNDIKQSYLRFLFFRRLASRASSVLSKPSGGGLQFQLVGIMGHGWLVLGILFLFNFQRKWMKLSTSAMGSVFVQDRDHFRGTTPVL